MIRKTFFKGNSRVGKILYQYRCGILSSRSISENTGISKSTVIRTLRKYYPNRSKVPRTWINKARSRIYTDLLFAKKTYQRYINGKDLTFLEKETGISRSAIWKGFKYHGFKTRTVPEVNDKYKKILTKGYLAKIKNLYVNRKYSFRELSEHTGINVDRLRLEIINMDVLRERQISIENKRDHITSSIKDYHHERLSKSPYNGIISYKHYKYLVHWLSKKLIKLNIIKINELVIEHKGYKKHLDHKFSISKGYTNEIKPYVTIFELAHPCNLEYILDTDNQAKNSKCSISIKELRENIKKYNKMFGDPFKDPKLESNRQSLFSRNVANFTANL